MASPKTAVSPAAPRLTRAEAKARTREQVLAAAEKVFGRDGYHGASLDRVAAEAGFTKGAVYSTFESKADLFLAILDRRAADRRGELESAFAAAEDVETFCANLARAFAESVAAEPEFWAALIEFMVFVSRDEAFAARYSAHHDTTRAALADSIRQWADRQGVPPAVEPRRAATAVIALNNGLTLEHLLSAEEVDVELYVEAQTALLLGAWRVGEKGGAR